MNDGFLKYPWLSSARIDFVRGGLYSGSLALALVFSGRPMAHSDATDALSSILSAPLPPSLRLLRLSGFMPTLYPEFLAFVKALTLYGLHVQVVIESEQAGPWLDTVQWITLRTKEPVLLFQPNEVWYEPADGSSIKDIVMPQLPNKITFMYFRNGLSTTETEAFFRASKYHWQLL